MAPILAIPTALAGGGGGAWALPLLAGASPGSLVTPDLGTMVWTWATFLLLFLLVKVFAWKPIAKSLEAREERIAGDVKRAEEARAKAEGLVAEYQKRLDQIRGEAQAIIAEGKADAEKVREKILADARTEGERLLAGATRDVTLAKQAALAELRAAAADLAVELSARALGRTLSPQDEQRLRQECLAELAGKA